MYFFLNTVFFGDVNKRLQICVIILLILCACVVDKYVDIIKLRQVIVVPYITLILNIVFVGNACALSVYTDYGVVFA